MRNYIFATTLFFLVNSCSEHEGNSQSSSINNVDTFTTYLINSDGSSRPLIDLVDQVEIVRLEETNESLLSGIAFLGHSEEQYAVTSWSNSDIHIFSQSGKFIRKINHQGNGPEEYPGIANFWATDNSIGISGGGFIIEYDWQGSFINKRKNPHMSYHTFPYQDGYVMDMSQSKIEENEHHSVIVVDSALQIESLLIPSKHHEIGLEQIVSRATRTPLFITTPLVILFIRLKMEPLCHCSAWILEIIGRGKMNRFEPIEKNQGVLEEIKMPLGYLHRT